MAEASPASGIFISYRRTDNPDATGRIYDRLVAEFGKARVFKDVDSIPLGQDFRTHLNDVVGACAAVIAIIGPRWVDVRDSGGQRRLDDPDDFVRIELEAALARGVPVLPVLVGHAQMPGTRELPPSLATLAFRQGVEVRPDPDFHNDATRLVAALRRILDPGTVPAEKEEGDHRPVAASPGPATDRRTGSGTPAPWPWIAAALTGLALAAVLAAPALRYLQQPTPPELRTEIVTPPTERPLDFALSPDGRMLAFVATDQSTTRLFIRSLDSTTARSLPGTEGAMRPFWSPDSRSIGYFTPTSLRRTDLNGSQSRVLSTSSSIAPGGGTWNRDDVILFAPSGTNSLFRVPASGGEPVQVTKTDSAQLGHVGPSFLPDGEHFVFVAFGSPSQEGVYLGSRAEGTPVRLTGTASTVAYTRSGWLITGRDQALFAQRLDLKRRALVGEPVALNQESGEDGRNSGMVSVADNGLIATRAQGTGMRQLQWFDRSGALLGSFGEPDASYSNPRLSPDGRRVAVDRTVSGNTDVWLLDGTRSTRLTFDPQVDARPLWTADGREIIFYSLRSGRLDLYRKPAEGADEEVRMMQDGPVEDRVRVPTGVSPDGKFLLYLSGSGTNATDLNLVRMTGTAEPQRILQTPFNEYWGVFSPDGRWIAYVSDETGRNEVYLTAFVPPDAATDRPAGARARWQVSASGGTFPVWRPDGRELYFLNPQGELMGAAITTAASSVDSGAPRALFATSIVGGGIEASQGRQYDVATDGRFLINVELQSGPVQPITLIQNWDPERAASR
jgi:Tol biopolymer transport system component